MMPMSRAVSGVDKSHVASHRPLGGVGRHRADGAVAHLMVWDCSGLYELPRPILRDPESWPGRVTHSEELSCRVARYRRHDSARRRDGGKIATLTFSTLLLHSD